MRPVLSSAQGELQQLVEASLKGHTSSDAAATWIVLRRAQIPQLFLSPQFGGLDLGLVERCVVLRAVGQVGADSGFLEQYLALLDDDPTHMQEAAAWCAAATSAPALEAKPPFLRGGDVRGGRGTSRTYRAAHLLGLADRSIGLAVARARVRMIGGRSLLEHQGTAHRLARSSLHLHRCEMSLWETAWAHDSGLDIESLSLATLAEVVEGAVHAARSTVQVFGASGTAVGAVAQLYETIHRQAAVCGPASALWDASATVCLAAGGAS